MSAKRRGFGIASIVAAGVVVAGVAVSGLTAGSNDATAMPTEEGYCSGNQVSVVMAGEDAGASVRRSALVFTARPGQSCKLTSSLPTTLRGAGTVVTASRQVGGPEVRVDAAHAASFPLSWTVAGAPGDQVTPSAISVLMPGQRGDSLAVPWTGGVVDDTAAGHIVNTGPTGPATR